MHGVKCFDVPLAGHIIGHFADEVTKNRKVQRMRCA